MRNNIMNCAWIRSVCNVAMFVLLALPAICVAQNDVVSAGGHAQNASASISYSFGQIAAEIYSDLVPNEGVQQAYHDDSVQRNATICLGAGYSAADFNIAAALLPAEGTYVFRDTIFGENVFGGDSIIILTITVSNSANLPQLAIVSQTPAACLSLGTLTLSASGGTAPYTYSVDGGAAQTSPDFSNLAAGVHTFTIFDNGGCQTDSVITIATDNSSPTVAVSDDAEICAGAAQLVSATVTGGTAPYTYAWLSVPAASGLPADVSQASIYVTPHQSTIYTVLVTDQNGCTGTGSVSITVNENVAPHSRRIDTACTSYSWVFADTAFTFTTVGSDTALHIYTDTNGCTGIDTLLLTITGNSSHTIAVAGCTSYTWAATGEVFTRDTVFPLPDYLDANGCASTDTLNVHIGSVGNLPYFDTSCFAYTWTAANGDNAGTYTASGIYTHDFLDTNNCPSTDTLHLTIATGTFDAYTVSECDLFRWDSVGTNGTGTNLSYTATGTYTSTYTNAYGCASADTLHLTIKSSGSVNIYKDTCDTYTWRHNGENVGTYITSGTYKRPFTAPNECAGADTLHLTINNSQTYTDVRTACDSLSWHGNKYKASTTTATYSTTTVHGCDSIVTLNLTISHTVATTSAVNSCTPYFWVDSTYAESTTAVRTIPSVAGCDSTVTLTISIIPVINTTETQTVCDSLLWNGNVYKESTSTPSVRFTTDKGCDSIATLNLTVKHSTDTSIYAQSERNYTYNGHTYTAAGRYTDTLRNSVGCDSLVRLNLAIIQGPIPHIVSYENKAVMINHYPNGMEYDRVDYIAYRWYQNGNLIPGASDDKYHYVRYAPLAGSFYVEVPADATMQFWVRSNTISFNGSKSNLAEDDVFGVYPNPVVRGSQVSVTIASDERCLVPGSLLKVFDLQGRMVYSVDVNEVVHQFVADFATGVYTIVLIEPNRDNRAIKLLVK